MALRLALLSGSVDDVRDLIADVGGWLRRNAMGLAALAAISVGGALFWGLIAFSLVLPFRERAPAEWNGCPNVEVRLNPVELELQRRRCVATSLRAR